MSIQKKSPIEEITLHGAGPIPGIPGSHGPGRYLVNWLERTISPIVDGIEEKVAEDVQAKSEKEADAETAPDTSEEA